MSKSVEQLEREHHLLWAILSNCHTTLSLVNEVYLPANVKSYVEMSLHEAQHVLKQTVPQDTDEAEE